MKKTMFVLVIILLAGSMVSFAGTKEFKKGALMLSPMLGFNSYAVPFGGSVELAINDKIGVGATVMFQSWGEDYSILSSNYSYSSTLITPSVQATYHFTGINMDKLDLYCGVSLGYSIYSFSWDSDFGGGSTDLGSSSIYLSPFLGARYYISSKMAIIAISNISAVGDWSGVGALVGVTFKLK